MKRWNGQTKSSDTNFKLKNKICVCVCGRNLSCDELIMSLVLITLGRHLVMFFFYCSNFLCVHCIPLCFYYTRVYSEKSMILMCESRSWNVSVVLFKFLKHLRNLDWCFFLFLFLLLVLLASKMYGVWVWDCRMCNGSYKQYFSVFLCVFFLITYSWPLGWTVKVLLI